MDTPGGRDGRRDSPGLRRHPGHPMVATEGESTFRLIPLLDGYD